MYSYDDYYGYQFDPMNRQPFGMPFGPQSGQPFGPPPCPSFGQPFGPPSGQPFGPPAPGAGTGPQSGPPSGPPPSFVPQHPPSTGVSAFAVDPGAIRPCMFRFVYLWLKNGRQFWAWLVFVGPRSVAGWRWTGFNWVYFGEDLRRIESFVCF